MSDQSNLENLDHAAMVAAAEGLMSGQEQVNEPELAPTPDPEPVAATESETPTEPTESFTSETVDDLEGLPQELVDRFKQREANMNKDYTQKNQALAEQRKQFDTLIESGYSAEDAVTAVQFLQKLNTDENFQAEFATKLQTYLGERGVGEPQATHDATDFEDDDSEYMPESLQRKLAEYDARFAKQQAQEQEMYFANKIHSQQMALREEFKYSESDIDAITKLGFSTQGDLIKANDLYLDMQKGWAKQYLRAKESVRETAPDIPPATYGEETVEAPKTIKDAGKDALAQLIASMNS